MVCKYIKKLALQANTDFKFFLRRSLQGKIFALSGKKGKSPSVSRKAPLLGINNKNLLAYLRRRYMANAKANAPKIAAQVEGSGTENITLNSPVPSSAANLAK